MKDRIKQLRKMLGLTQTEFGEKIGLTTSAISDIERGKVKNITYSSVILICQIFNVSEKWLRDGEGEPYSNEYEFRLNLLDETIVKKIRALDGDDRKIVENVINGLYEKAMKNKHN